MYVYLYEGLFGQLSGAIFIFGGLPNEHSSEAPWPQFVKNYCMKTCSSIFPDPETDEKLPSGSAPLSHVWPE
jgi:hypothetical protein